MKVRQMEAGTSLRMASLALFRGKLPDEASLVGKELEYSVRPYRTMCIHEAWSW